MDCFDKQTLNDLEFSTIQEWLVEYGVGPTAKEKLASLSPSNHFPSIEIDLKKVNELLSIRNDGESFPALDFEELQIELRLLGIKNSVLSLEGYIRISRASELVNSLIYFFNKREKDYPLLSALFENAYFTTEIIEAIDKVFDRAGNVKDDASKLSEDKNGTQPNQSQL
jgi:DNA mismatch repair protein MutS2